MRLGVLSLLLARLVLVSQPSFAREATARINCEGFEGIKPPQMLLSIWSQPPKAGDFAIVSVKCGEKVEVLGGGSEPG